MNKKAIKHVYLPNETIYDLQLHIENSSQTAFAYSYLYYITYLYRYCDYIDENGEKVTQRRIKEYLGYSPKNKKLDYIIKKGGILDTLQYTLTTTDYPLQFLYDSNNLISFETIADYKDNIKNINDRNFKVKYPIRAFHRSPRAILSRSLTGTFYDVSNTHRIDYDAFKGILENPKLGCVAFYIYGFLKQKNNMFRSGYQRSFEKIGLELSMSDKTVRKYIDLLEEYGYLRVERKFFNLHANLEDELEANIYNVV